MTPLEIFGHPADAQAQNSRGQIFTADLETDEKAVLIEHPRPLLHALGRRPADPLIARPQIECGAAKTEGPQPAVFRSHQIAQLPSDQPTLV
jgi:hypothetical protein